MSGLPHGPPINQLPVEILAEIYSLVSFAGVHLTQQPRIPNYQMPNPWVLARVCKLWRDIAFSAPQLWSNITVKLDQFIMEPRPGFQYDTLITAWKHCLERSGNHPLTFRLEGRLPEAKRVIPNFLGPLMGHIGQWKSAVFNFPLTILIPFISDPEIQYPSLCDLTLAESRISIDSPDIPLFRHAFLLSKLTLLHFIYSPFELRLPWSQITELELHTNEESTNIQNLLDGLRKTPNLSTLTVNRLASRCHEEPVTPVVELPYLRRLFWKSTDVEQNHSFFRHICAPQLVGMGFYSGDGNPELSPARPMQNFVCSSGCTIRSLALRMIGPQMAVSLFEALPHVETLTLFEDVLCKKFLEELTLDESKPSWLLPELKRMQVICGNWLGIFGGFVRMVQSRFRVPLQGKGRGSRLESLSIRNNLPIREALKNGQLHGIYVAIRQELSQEEMASIKYVVNITVDESYMERLDSRWTEDSDLPT